MRFLEHLIIGATIGTLLTAACSKDDASSNGSTSSSSSGGTNADGGGGSSSGGQSSGSVDGGGSSSSSGSTSSDDGGVQGPTFDLASVAKIEGSFVTDKTGLNGAQSSATVSWHFKIDQIKATTAQWSAEATDVAGGNLTDFPADTAIELAVTANGTGSYDLYATQNDPHYAYVLVQIRNNKIADLFYYRRLLDDTETNPADKPRNVVYTAP